MRRWRPRRTGSTSIGSTGCGWRRRPSPTSRATISTITADFDAYFEAKLALFTRVLPRSGAAVINLDDPRGAAVAEAARARGQRTITIGRDEGCALRLTAQRFDATGQEALFVWEGRTHSARLDLIGGFQAHNALIAAGLAIGAGADAEAVFAALPGLETVRGRMQRAATRRNGASVFVDYAHTPDALTTALAALRPHVMRPAPRRLRRRRRPGPRQAAADGRRGRGGRGRRLRHRRQPALGGPGGDPRGDPRRLPRGDRDRRPRRGDPDGGRRARAAATRCWSRARATRPARSSATTCCPSTTPSRRAWRSRRSTGSEHDGGGRAGGPAARAAGGAAPRRPVAPGAAGAQAVSRVCAEGRQAPEEAAASSGASPSVRDLRRRQG